MFVFMVIYITEIHITEMFSVDFGSGSSCPFPLQNFMFFFNVNFHCGISCLFQCPFPLWNFMFVSMSISIVEFHVDFPVRGSGLIETWRGRVSCHWGCLNYLDKVRCTLIDYGVGIRCVV